MSDLTAGVSVFAGHTVGFQSEYSNGNGITAEQLSDPKAFGLITVRERAYSWGGDIKIESQPGKGTSVSVNIPLITKALNPKTTVK